MEPTSPTCHLDSVPNDVLDHLLQYFDFQHWILFFILVCKRWKRICESTKMAPKQLRVITRRCFDLGRAMLWIKKYQPTILELRLAENQKIPSSTLARLVGASARLNTLILCGYDLEERAIEYTSALDRITTLALNEPLYQLKRISKFPNLKRLQVTYCDPEIIPQLNVDELTIIHKDKIDFDVAALKIRKLTIVRTLNIKIVEFVDDSIKETELKMDDLSLEQYLRYSGRSKLHACIQREDFEKAAKLLDTVTTEEYEIHLENTVPTRYTYPTNLSIWSGDYDPVQGNELAFKLLVDTKKITIADSPKYITLVQLNRIEEALDVMEHGSIDVRNDRVQDSFFKMLKSPHVSQDTFKKSSKLSEIAKKMIDREIKYGMSDARIKKKVQFEKISFLRDWTGVQYLPSNVELLWAMIDKGADIPYDRLKVDQDQLLDSAWARGGPALLQEVLCHVTDVKLALQTIARYGFEPLSEFKGRAVMFLLLRNQTYSQLKDILKEHINHMDSNGDTFLSTAIPIMDNRHIADILKLGADPNLFRSDKPSPLALAIIRSSTTTNMEAGMVMIDNPLLYGADINRTCVFEGQICSPLMIAVKLGAPLCVIRLLVALGALVDYRDGSGQSIVDCLIERKDKHDAAYFKDLMHLLTCK